jgi:hypothetical protein
MIGQTISHYAPKEHPSPIPTSRDWRPSLADKILEKLGESGMSENSLRTCYVSSWNFQDPPFLGGGVKL